MVLFYNFYQLAMINYFSFIIVLSKLSLIWNFEILKIYLNFKFLKIILLGQLKDI